MGPKIARIKFKLTILVLLEASVQNAYSLTYEISLLNLYIYIYIYIYIFFFFFFFLIIWEWSHWLWCTPYKSLVTWRSVILTPQSGQTLKRLTKPEGDEREPLLEADEMDAPTYTYTHTHTRSVCSARDPLCSWHPAPWQLPLGPSDMRRGASLGEPRRHGGMS